MKIAVVGAPWWPVPPPKYGSSELVVDGLARGLHAIGQNVTLFATNDSTCPVPRFEASIASQPQHHGLVGIETQYVAEVYENLDEFDVVHDHTVSGPLYARAFKNPKTVVTTNHGLFNDILNPVFESISRWAAVVAISKSHAATASFPVAAAIHHGINTDELKPGTERGEHFLAISRMTPEKGVHIAARVARKVGVPLLIAARMQTKDEQAYFESEVRPLLGNGVEFIGEIGPEQKIPLMQSARAVLNPIVWAEPFGLVMAESLACGTPVISFPNGAAPEILDDGVTAFLPTTEEEMVDACLRIDEIDRAQCRKVSEERFSLERMARDHLALYESLHERGGTRTV